MLLGIAGFEIRYQLRNPVFWVSAAIFFLLGFGLTASENVSIGTPGAVHENAPVAIANAFAIMGLFFQLVITSFVANAIIRDDATGFGTIIRSTSVTRFDFVLGRFAGGLAIALIGYLAVPLGLFVGSLMPWVDPETVGPNKFAYYAWHFLIIAIPNVLFSSAFLFGLATITRSMMGTYIGVVVFLMSYLVATAILGPLPEYQDLLARYEPLGMGAMGEATRYWTTAEFNTRLVPLAGNFLFNRIFVMLLALFMLVVTVARYSMSERAPSKRRLRKLARTASKEAGFAAVPPVISTAPVRAEHGSATMLAQLLMRAKTELVQVLKSPGLIVLLLLGMANTAAALWFSETAYGTPSHPLTADVIDATRQNFGLFLLIVAVFYGGELVWRERDRKLNEIIDSAPVSDWIMVVPKVLAIFAVLVIMTLGAAVTGILFELIKGTGGIEFGHYLTWLVLPEAFDAFLLAVLAVFMQVVSPNKYVGWGLMMVWFINGIFLGNMGFESQLYRYSNASATPLSDMNGAGTYMMSAFVGRAYWGFFALLLMVVAHLIWPRGSDLQLRGRLSRIRSRMSTGVVAIGLASLAGMIVTGWFIHYNTTVLNTYRTSEDMEKLQADLEKHYLKYEKLPRPTVTAVKLDAQIYPGEQRMDVTGSYQMVNNSGEPISQVHLRQGNGDVKFSELTVTGARQVRYDKDYGYYFFRFDQPLAVGATASLNFKSQIWQRGFRHGPPATTIVENGTFANNQNFAPIIGMSRDGLLTDRAKRRRNGLPPQLRPAKLEDLAAQKESYTRTDWVTADISVTTDADQTPIAPGRAIVDAVANGRRTVRFISDAPILNFFSVQSARYAIAWRTHRGVDLAVYYHPKHGWNVPVMLSALQVALDYYQANFGPYQFKQARIIEFPGYAQFAQAFANTMPFSESIGFAADVADKDAIDYVTYVTAHELGHQYWAHQVIGADMQGGTLTTETMAQYSALMVMKKIYGRDKIRQFLKYELDNYLRSRKGEVVEELPLIRVEDQGYIHYRKGSLVMFLLQERLGEAAVNRALARFITRFKFKGAPYHRSVDLIEEFRNEAGSPSDQALITDLFEKITIYDLKAKEAKITKDTSGHWVTKVTVEADKFYADGKGVETKAPLSEPIEVGLFSARPGVGAFAAKDVIVMGRQLIKGGKQIITLKSKAKPAFAGIDPYNFHIDRNSDDNLIDAKQ